MKTQNGTTRRRVLAGLMTLPAVAVLAGLKRAHAFVIAPRKDVITQVEIKALLGQMEGASATLEDFRRRWVSGATVELGEGVTEEFGGHLPVVPILLTGALCELSGLVEPKQRDFNSVLPSKDWKRNAPTATVAS